MSLHRSLKTKSGALEAHRSVLTRAERLGRLKEDGRFDDEKSPLHLPKVRNIKVSTGKKSKKAEGEGEGVEGAAPGATAAAPAGAAPAAGAKAGAKAAPAAAPAAKPAGKGKK